MFDSLLIANRGEIACRIIRSCRRLGIRTVAVHSTADANALHVELADEKHCIGPAQARASYLNADAIIAAALEHGAAAIHPGYGFLSEKPELPDLCARHGLIWVGPSARCIRLMGSKIEAKRYARDHGVYGVPGYDGEEQDARALLREAETIGFPVLIKASAGGGGKGMRRVEDAASFPAALDTARREARGAFGDDRVMLEKYIGRPRHLEVQLAGDHHGNVIHLFERECSIQRNYQKVVEEAPAARLAASVRHKLLDSAVRLGRAIGYDSLGTVEFLVDADRDDADPCFLEMNTRLQVEHPVTELVTGLDLVELQLRIAAGESLPLRQEEVRATGHAIEVRLAAENPAEAYCPDVGRIHDYREPRSLEGIRVDSGVRAGSEVTAYYDSMLAKLIASGPDRETSTRRLLAALDQFIILGVRTNRHFLREIIRHPAFSERTLTTGFIQQAFPQGYAQSEPDAYTYSVAALASILPSLHGAAAGVGVNAWTTLAGFRVLARAGQLSRCRLSVSHGASPKTVALSRAASGRIDAEVDGQTLELHVRPAAGGFEVRWGERAETVVYHCEGSLVFLHARGRTEKFEVRPLLEILAAQARGGGVEKPHLSAALTGMITSVDVRPGQSVTTGQTLIVMEAMKLVHTLVAPTAGIIGAVHCSAGQIVTSGTRLIDIDVVPDAAA